MVGRPGRQWCALLVVVTASLLTTATPLHASVASSITLESSTLRIEGDTDAERRVAVPLVVHAPCSSFDYGFVYVSVEVIQRVKGRTVQETGSVPVTCEDDRRVVAVDVHDPRWKKGKAEVRAQFRTFTDDSGPYYPVRLETR